MMKVNIGSAKALGGAGQVKYLAGLIRKTSVIHWSVRPHHIRRRTAWTRNHSQTKTNSGKTTPRT